ncbi:MAG TPA: oxalurate catabolism protein HpxZ [Xanthobacteraceae bacterium]|nr:oxalurate catabolism protein HpxZ [Xanthobacteraceae bacterium]
MSAPLEVNDPQVLADLTAAFEAYERALVDNDIPALNRMFWDSPLTLRYGTRAHELLRSHAEIAEFRLKRGAVDQRRTLRNTRIVTFGRDFGVANTEFSPAGSDKIGRQSQTWVRTAEGWKIVSAHVSFGA